MIGGEKPALAAAQGGRRAFAAKTPEAIEARRRALPE